MAAKKADEEMEAQFSKWIEEVGGEAHIAKMFDLRRERWERMTDQYDDLLMKYPDQWIAITDREEPFVAGSSEELLAKLDEAGIDRNTAVMKFIRARHSPDDYMIHGFFGSDGHAYLRREHPYPPLWYPVEVRRISWLTREPTLLHCILTMGEASTVRSPNWRIRF